MTPQADGEFLGKAICLRINVAQTKQMKNRGGEETAGAPYRLNSTSSSTEADKQETVSQTLITQDCGRN